jgi:osmotically-inducible protein OsmY
LQSGVVTLAGYVKSYSDKYEAEAAAKRVAGVSGVANDLEVRLPIKGVKGVTNLVQLKPRVQPEQVKNKIEEAFRRNAEVDANRIIVETNGSQVILKGTVRSWIEREEAERVAWSAPGVTNVDDRIIVSP